MSLARSIGYKYFTVSAGIEMAQSSALPVSMHSAS